MLTQRVDLFDSTYGHFTQDVLAAIRRETFGADIGQNSWLTVEEYDRFISWLKLQPEQHVLEVASGSGGPALYLADRASCHVTGIDSNEHGVAEATRAALDSHQSHRISFRVADANCAAAVRQRHVRCARVHRFDESLSRSAARFPGVAARSTPRQTCGLHRSRGDHEAGDQRRPGAAQLDRPIRVHAARRERALHRDRRPETAAPGGCDPQRGGGGRPLASRAGERHREALLEIEGEERFDGLQKFFAAVHRLTSERRLSRVAYLVEKPAS